MGCVFCCLRHNLEEQEHSAGNCIGLHSLTQLVEDVYHSLFQRRERVAPADEQGTAPPAAPAPTSVQVNSRVDTDFLPPRPSLDNDPRCSQLQYQNDQNVFCAKGPTCLHEKSVLLRFENFMHTESTVRKENLNGSKDEGGSKTCYSESSPKQPLAEMTAGIAYLNSAYLDEDVCSICLEEYTSENPRIPMQCTHHYHLSCIYEWMERSQTCPFCSKVMLFSEET